MPRSTTTFIPVGQAPHYVQISVIGSGYVETTIAACVAEVGHEVTAIDIDPGYVENPIPEAVYVHDTCADTSAFEAATGWAPAIDFEEGLRRVCAQYTDATAETEAAAESSSQ